MARIKFRVRHPRFRPFVEALEERCVMTASLDGVEGISPLMAEVQQRYVTVIPGGNEVNPNGSIVRLDIARPGKTVLMTGTLLPTRRHILTAAHGLTDSAGNFDVLSSTITFHMEGGPETRQGLRYYVHSGWDPVTLNHDIAIIEFAQGAPPGVNGIEIYRGSDEVGDHLPWMVKLGYGWGGTGDTGATPPAGTLRWGFNRYDALADIFADGVGVDFQPPGSIAPGTRLAYDFDNGLAANDAFGVIFGIHHTGQGEYEVNAAPGDSGGPTLFEGALLAGVTSYGFGFLGDPDVLPGTNSSYGEISVDTRVSAYANWIDEAQRGPILGLFRPSNGEYRIDTNNSREWEWSGEDGDDDFHVDTRFVGDRPVVGDWNLDGTSDMGYLHGSGSANLQWYLDLNGNRGWEAGIDGLYNWGIGSDKPAAGDWNGDGMIDFGVARNVDGKLKWILDLNGNRSWDPGIDGIFDFGNAGARPAVGDWNGDGLDDVGIVLNENSSLRWYLDLNGNRAWNPAVDSTHLFGLAGDKPAVADWNGDGISDFGVAHVAGSVLTWSLDLNGTRAYEVGTDGTYSNFGVAGDLPAVGFWNGPGLDGGDFLQGGGSSMSFMGLGESSGMAEIELRDSPGVIEHEALGVALTTPREYFVPAIATVTLPEALPVDDWQENARITQSRETTNVLSQAEFQHDVPPLEPHRADVRELDEVFTDEEFSLGLRRQILFLRRMRAME